MKTRKGRKPLIPKTVRLPLDFFQISDSHCPRSTGGGMESEGNLRVQILFAEDRNSMGSIEGKSDLKPVPDLQVTQPHGAHV